MYSCETKSRCVLAFFPFLAILLCPIIDAKAQMSDERAREAARVAIQSSEQTGKNMSFSLYRREDLEDQFCSFGWFRGGFDKKPCAFLFKVSQESYEFHDNKVNHHSCVGACADYCVVVSVPSSEVFLVRGLQASRDEFNRLAKAYRITIDTDTQAEVYVRLYLALMPQNLHLESPGRAVEFKQMIEEKFVASSERFAEAEKRFSVWWEKYGNAISLQAGDWTATQGPSGYVVTFITVSDIDEKHRSEGPALLRVTFEVTKEGQMTGPRFEPVAVR